MSLGGQITDDDIRNYLAMQTAAPTGPAPMPYSDPTFMAQQAILSRPMRPSFTGQPLMSREVPVGNQSYNGMAYPSMQNNGLLNVPSYTSRYAASDSGGGGGGGAMQTGPSIQDPYSLSNGLVASLLGMSAVPNLAIPVSDMGTSAAATQQEAAQQAANQALNDLSARQESQMNAAPDSGGYNSSDYGGYSGSETQSSGEAYAN